MHLCQQYSIVTYVCYSREPFAPTVQNQKNIYHFFFQYTSGRERYLTNLPFKKVRQKCTHTHERPGQGIVHLSPVLSNLAVFAKQGMDELKARDGSKVSFRDLLGLHDLWKSYAERLVSQCRSNQKLLQQRVLSADLQVHLFDHRFPYEVTNCPMNSPIIQWTRRLPCDRKAVCFSSCLPPPHTNLHAWLTARNFYRLHW